MNSLKLRMPQLLAFVLALFLVPGAHVLALILVPCSGSACRACDLVELVNNLLTFIIAISVLIATIIFMWAGFTFVTANGNTGQIKKAKESFKDVFIGIIIVLLGFLIVDTVMQFLVGPDLLAGGRWNDIKCVPNATINTVPGWNPNAPTTTTPVTPGATTTPGGPVTIPPGEFGAALAAYTGKPTTAGPDGGNKACVWAVNNILESAGYAPIARSTENVGDMENAIRAGRGEQITDMSGAKAGDIVISSGRQHVGMCVNDGCSRIMSNSSGSRSFSWQSNVNFDGYYGGASRVYRVNKGR